MKIVIPGGSGHLGTLLRRALDRAGHEIVAIGRRPGSADATWNGRDPGAWAEHLDGADAVINLAGRSVDCRYNVANLREMMDSRVFSTRAVGLAIARAKRPPQVWLQMSTATIYAHRFDAANDETTGLLGGEEPDTPAYWRYSIEIAQAWERALEQAPTPLTRKVALRTAMVMSDEPGAVFSVLLGLTRFGLGGTHGKGRHYMSWIHQEDFTRAIEFLLDRDGLSGPFNLAAPNPLPQREFMRVLRQAWGIGFGLPAKSWMLELGAWLRRSDTELLLKSRRVVPGRLLRERFDFRFPGWESAAADLVERWKARPRRLRQAG